MLLHFQKTLENKKCQQFGEPIISFLKNPLCIEDRNLRHFNKRSGFQLLDLSEAGIRDALVAQVKGGKEVIRFVLVLIFAVVDYCLLVYRTLMTARSCKATEGWL